MSQPAAEVQTTIDYLVPTSRINRRFWAPGREFNTGVYAPYPVTVRSARLAGPFTLDEHGFCLGQHSSGIADWENSYAPDSAYAAQVCEVAMRLSGADVVVPMSGMVRTSGPTSATMQPPAAEAHVDFTQNCATRIAETIYRKAHPNGPGYRRFIAFSLWRALSPPPQDMPLALCEGGSVRDDEGTRNTKVDVTEIPAGDALYAPIVMRWIAEFCATADARPHTRAAPRRTSESAADGISGAMISSGPAMANRMAAARRFASLTGCKCCIPFGWPASQRVTCSQTHTWSIRCA
jgi:hypothetical protein